MVRGTVNVRSGVDRIAEIQKQIAELAKKEVLVGITEEKAARKNGDGINNAELLYAHSNGIRKQEMRKDMQQNLDGGMKYSAAHSLYLQEHGSPLWQVPPRPVLEPAIDDSKEIIGRQLRQASLAALEGKPARVRAEMNKAGMLGEAAAKGWFENPKNGWLPNSEKTIKMKGSDLPLIDTGEMRKAITYVVRDKS